LVEHTESIKPERLVEREHMLEEAENIFVALGAEPWESRLESLRSMPSSVATGTDS
jgi:hypothetical protein